MARVSAIDPTPEKLKLNIIIKIIFRIIMSSKKAVSIKIKAIIEKSSISFFSLYFL
jgi:hypothetical protein